MPTRPRHLRLLMSNKTLVDVRTLLKVHAHGEYNGGRDCGSGVACIIISGKEGAKQCGAFVFVNMTGTVI